MVLALQQVRDTLRDALDRVDDADNAENHDCYGIGFKLANWTIFVIHSKVQHIQLHVKSRAIG
jgi:hypothetical protein